MNYTISKIAGQLGWYVLINGKLDCEYSSLPNWKQQSARLSFAGISHKIIK